nr:hypothetical protein [uncultured Dongia sp.]
MSSGLDTMPLCHIDLRLIACCLPLLAVLPGAATASEACFYDIKIADATASRLDMDVRCSDQSLLDILSPPDDAAAAFIERIAAPSGHATFSIDLSGFAAASQSRDGALRVGGSLLVTPSAIIPAPLGDVDLTFAIAGGDAALSLPRGSDGAYYLSAGRLRDAGEWVFGHFGRIAVDDMPALAIVQLDAALALTPDGLGRWIGDVAASNARFWGRVPVDPTLLVLMPDTGVRGLSGGRVMAAGGATILLRIGDQTALFDFYEEWVLVHEFLHLGSPLVRDTGIWFNEGIATYFEPILRARAGWKTEDAVWLEWIDWMPRGVADLGPPGLAQARRPYWGGALFMLLADIELRRRSDGRRGVEDCLRDILRQGANIAIRWPTAAVIAACDQDDGDAGVFAGLAARYLYGGEVLDLDTLWRNLGVSKSDTGGIVYDDTAPLAHVRQAIVWGGADQDWAPIGGYRATP